MHISGGARLKEFYHFEGGVTVYKGETFDVVLESQSASTGYSWALSVMPNCLNLLDVSSVATTSPLAGSTNKQVFKFAAVEEAEACLEFSLCRPWEPLMIVQKKIYVVRVCGQDSDVGRELLNTMGTGKFVPGGIVKARASSLQRPAIPYGIPLNIVEDSENCNVMYGMVNGVALNPEDCILKYGVPANLVKDDADCIVKYGTPFGVAVNPEDCIIKYGAPVRMFEDKNNCIVKYGTPSGAAKEGDDCILKYGAPISNPEARDIGVLYGVLYGVPCENNSNVLPVYKTAAENPIVVYGTPPTPQYGVAVLNMETASRSGRNQLSPYKIVDGNDFPGSPCVIKYGVFNGVAMNPHDCVLKYGIPVPENPK
jgi:predicted secreted protein